MAEEVSESEIKNNEKPEKETIQSAMSAIDNDFYKFTDEIFTDYINKTSNKAVSWEPVADRNEGECKEHYQPFYFADFNNDLGNLMLVPGANGNVVGSIPSIEKQTNANVDPTKFSVDCHQITRMPYISLFDTKILLQHYNETKTIKNDGGISASTYFGHEFERFYKEIDNSPNNPKTTVAKEMKKPFTAHTDFFTKKTELFKLLCNLINKKVDIHTTVPASATQTSVYIDKLPPNKWNYKHLVTWIEHAFGTKYVRNKMSSTAATEADDADFLDIRQGQNTFLYKSFLIFLQVVQIEYL